MILVVDSFLGGDNFYILSQTLISYLSRNGFSRLSHVENLVVGGLSSSYWMSIVDLGLVSELAIEWNSFVAILNNLGITVID